jgi:hypothetical protein
MNRKILDGITVLDGMYYANDALQYICSNICSYSNTKMLEIQDKCFENKDLYESKEYMNMARLQDNFITLFNSIVSKGSEFSIKFIENNINLI